jgi:hypothetical protein
MERWSQTWNLMYFLSCYYKLSIISLLEGKNHDLVSQNQAKTNNTALMMSNLILID